MSGLNLCILGEPEITFWWESADETGRLAIWEGYFDTFAMAIQCSGERWIDVLMMYHMSEGWCEHRTEIVDKKEFLNAWISVGGLCLGCSIEQEAAYLAILNMLNIVDLTHESRLFMERS